MRKLMRPFVLLAGIAILAAMGIFLASCGTSSGSVDTSGVAATADGVDIQEADVTAMIAQIRTQVVGADGTDADWASMLVSAKYTPESLREDIIRNQFAAPILVINDAKALGITPDESAIDDQINQAKSQAGDDAGWASYLASIGYADEDAFRTLLEAENVYNALITQKLAGVTHTDQEINDFLTQYAPYYVGKKSSAITINITDTVTADQAKTKAAEALALIQGGEDFDTVAAQYSDPPASSTDTSSTDTSSTDTSSTDTSSTDTSATDTSSTDTSATDTSAADALTADATATDTSATDTSSTDTTATDTTSTDTSTDTTSTDPYDMGWSAMSSSLPQEYLDALDNLDVGQVSDIVETDTAVYIIKCTDSYQNNADGSANLDTMPDDIRADLMNYFNSNASDTFQSTYISDLAASTDRIVINPMPTGLPYDVDLSLASQSSLNTQTTDDVVGTGATAESGDVIRVTYVGTLDDGTVFDQSSDHDGYYKFTLGAGTVIAGWDEGIVGMQVGGTRELTVPPEKGYGSSGYGTIPANATLHFTIQLLSVNGDDTGAEDIISSLGLDFSDVASDANTTSTDTSATDTSATDTSAADTSSTDTSATDTSSTDTSSTDTSATDTSATDTSSTDANESSAPTTGQ